MVVEGVTEWFSFLKHENFSSRLNKCEQSDGTDKWLFYKIKIQKLKHVWTTSSFYFYFWVSIRFVQLWTSNKRLLMKYQKRKTFWNTLYLGRYVIVACTYITQETAAPTNYLGNCESADTKKKTSRYFIQTTIKLLR